MQVYLLFGLKYGLRPEDVCGAAGISPLDLADRDRQIPYAWHDAVRRTIIARLPHVNVGLEAGTFTSLDQFGYLGQAAKHARTLLDAARLLIRCARLLDSIFAQIPYRLEISESTVELWWPAVPLHPPDPPEAIEASFVNYVNMLRALSTHELTPRGVYFGHARTPEVQRQFLEYFRCPVTFECERHSLVFDRSFAEEPIRHSTDDAWDHYTKHLDEVLARLDEPLTTLVARAIESSIRRGNLTQLAVAQLLGLSVRALQRRLKEHGITYHALVVETRKTLAMQLLADPALAVYEVAFGVGYDEVTAFNRAFRQWTGSSPGDYRRMRSGTRIATGS